MTLKASQALILSHLYSVLQTWASPLSEPLGDLLETYLLTGSNKPPRRQDYQLGTLGPEKSGDLDYLQFDSETVSTRARQASSTRKRALRTLIAERAAGGQGWRSGGTVPALGRLSGAASSGSALPALLRPSLSTGGRSSQGRRGPPAPSPQPGRGSGDWDISWKLFAAGGGGRVGRWGGQREGGRRPREAYQRSFVTVPSPAFSFFRK